MASTLVEADHTFTDPNADPRTVSGKRPSAASLQREREYIDWLAARAIRKAMSSWMTHGPCSWRSAAHGSRGRGSRNAVIGGGSSVSSTSSGSNRHSEPRKNMLIEQSVSEHGCLR